MSILLNWVSEPNNRNSDLAEFNKKKNVSSSTNEHCSLRFQGDSLHVRHRPGKV